MAKIEIQIEDLDDGEIRVSVKSDRDFPADTSKWSTAQHAAMSVHHNLGCAQQDLATMEDRKDHDADCNVHELGPCNCPAGELL